MNGGVQWALLNASMARSVFCGAGSFTMLAIAIGAWQNNCMLASVKSKISREFFSALAALPARAPDDLQACREGPIAVAGLFQTASGVGETARRCAAALEAEGYPVQRFDLSAHFRQADLDLGMTAQPLPAAPSGVLLLHVNAPETVAALRRLRLFRPRRWRVVGVWVWEFEVMPDVWRPAARFLSEIWAPTVYCAAAFQAKVDIPVRIVPYMIKPPERVHDRRASFGLADGELVVLSMADGRSSFTRKNLAASIAAFREAFAEERENVRLVLKTRNLDYDAPAARELRRLAATDPRIVLIDEALSEAERWSLLAACDIYLSLHRCEGFGLPMAEAMALGKPVVATAWSGNMEFMSPETAMLTPARLEPVDDRSGIYKPLPGARWADPDIEAASAALRRLAENAEMRASLGSAASAFIREKLTGRSYVEALKA